MHGDLIHVRPLELHALTSPWPFSVEGPSWDDDLLRDISSSKGIHRRLIQQLPLSMREVRDSWMLAIAFLCWAT